MNAGIFVLCLSAFACASAVPAKDTQGANVSEQASKNKRVIQKFYEEFLNQQKNELVAELVSPSFVDHSNGSRGVEGVEKAATGLKTAFEGLHFEISDVFAEGDLVALRWVRTGKQIAPFFGVAPTGQPSEARGTNIYRLSDGKITESWIGIDPSTIRAQLQATNAR